jgi:hypothetical protein
VTASRAADPFVARGADDVVTVESGFDAVATLSRRLRGAGIEDLLLERRRRNAVTNKAADYCPCHQL